MSFDVTLKQVVIFTGVGLVTIAMTGCGWLNEQNPNLGLPEYQMSTTGMGAATGAAIGAGLGAIIGSTSGDAGAGLAIGGVAGATAGGIIGGGLQQQEEDNQEYAANVSRQQRRLKAQNRDVQEVKKRTLDAPAVTRSVPTAAPVVTLPAEELDARGRITETRITENTFGNDFSDQPSDVSQNLNLDTTSGKRAATPFETAADSEHTFVVPPLAARQIPPIASSANSSELPPARTVEEKTVVEKAEPELTTPEVENAAAIKVEKVPEKVETKAPIKVAKVEAKTESAAEPKGALSARSTLGTASHGVAGGSSAQCSAEAQSEASRAEDAVSDADKLFYYRRALRLCPTEASYHHEIGNVYVSIGRIEDAEKEYRQALELDPSNLEVEKQLSLLEKDNAP